MQKLRVRIRSCGIRCFHTYVYTKNTIYNTIFNPCIMDFVEAIVSADKCMLFHYHGPLVNDEGKMYGITSYVYIFLEVIKISMFSTYT